MAIPELETQVLVELPAEIKQEDDPVETCKYLYMCAFVDYLIQIGKVDVRQCPKRDPNACNRVIATDYPSLVPSNINAAIYEVTNPQLLDSTEIEAVRGKNKRIERDMDD
jgi:hypothetical protein